MHHFTVEEATNYSISKKIYNWKRNINDNDHNNNNSNNNNKN